MERTTVGILVALLTLFAASLVLIGPAIAQDSTQRLYKIYSNLGPNGNGACYDPHDGWNVGLGQSIAMPFTPKAGAKLSEIVLGLLFDGAGGDFVIVSLNEDDNGLPGKTIHAWVLGKLGMNRWHSCYVTIARSKKQLPLKGGIQYWVAATAPFSTADIWKYTYNDSEGDFAYEGNNGGWNPYDSYLSAFGVFGTKAN